MTIEAYKVLVDIAEKGRLVDGAEAEMRATLAEGQRVFDENCQGVPLVEPSKVSSICALAGRWKGLLEREILYAPDAQTQVWVNQFDGITDKYCTP